jgi:hypothetical protein
MSPAAKASTMTLFLRLAPMIQRIIAECPQRVV